MKTTCKRAVSWLLTACMVLSLIPAMAPAALAAETEELTVALAEAQAVASGFTTTVTDLSSNTTLRNKTIYLITSDTSVCNLEVTPDATAVINIKQGVTLQVYADPTKAAIALPTTSTLIVVGGGRLMAYGGAGTAGSRGGNGGDSQVVGSRQVLFGDGGWGGDGGMGPGAGIGGAGGYGGRGGKNGRGMTIDIGRDVVFQPSGGIDGWSGSSGGDMGTLYVLNTATVTAQAGQVAGVGGSGSGGASSQVKPFGVSYVFGAGGGGGGAVTVVQLTPGKTKTHASVVSETSTKAGTVRTYAVVDRDGLALQPGREVLIGTINERGMVRVHTTVKVDGKSNIKVTIPTDGCTIVLLDPMSFDDVGKGDWFFNAVQHMFYNDLMQGTGPITYEPQTITNRAMVATLLYRFAGSPASNKSLEQFKDADKTSAYAIPAMRWAVEQGLLTGKVDGILDPTGYATRAELAAIITRYLDLA